MVKKKSESVASFLSGVVARPEVLVLPQADVADQSAKAVKQLFERGIASAQNSSIFQLKELHTEDFDHEQIWSQLQMQNAPVLRYAKRKTKWLLQDLDAVSVTSDGKLKQATAATRGPSKNMELPKNMKSMLVEEEDFDSDEPAADDETKSDEGDLPDLDDEEDIAQKKKFVKKQKPDELGFFAWEDMDREADMEDEEMVASDSEDVSEDDEDEEGELSDDGRNIKYEDLFGEDEDKPDNLDGDSDNFDDVNEEEEEQVEEEEEEEDEEDGAFGKEPNWDEMTPFQKQAAKMQEKITEMEEDALAEKPWLFKGETQSRDRPENSLLEAEVEFARNLPPPPEITIESTADLEDVIKTRCREERWDDPIRKVLETPTSRAKLEEVSQEKSSLGLGEIYAKEYEKTAMGVEQTDKSKKEQDEIERMFAILCGKLDSLSNFHFTPKPHVEEARIAPAVPAIAMEEAVPMAVSDSNLRAPEEVFEKKKGREGVLRGASEMGSEDKKRKRRAEKSAKKKARLQKEHEERHLPKEPSAKEDRKKLKELISTKQVTEGTTVKGSTKQFTKSGAFFQNLQESIETGTPKKASKKQDAAESNAQQSAALKM